MTNSSLLEINLEKGSILLIDKPLRWTSFDVVNKLKSEIKNNFGIKKFKIGHAGTLDPLASGLLIVCVGKCTKQITDIQNLTKTYIGTFTIGATTASFDLEKPIENQMPYQHITAKKIEETKETFIGEIEQVPPMFSAIKINGQKAYQKARQDENVELNSRLVHIYRFEITKIDLPNIEFEIECSKGTYIRSIARDFGKMLGCGAYLSQLRRTAIGNYRIENTIDFSSLYPPKNKEYTSKKKKDFEL